MRVVLTMCASCALLVACEPSPADLCRRYSEAVTDRQAACPGAGGFDRSQCDSVTSVRDRSSFEECVAAIDTLDCGSPLPDTCQGQLR